MKSARGFTLVELMLAVAIMVVAVAAACLILVSTVSMARNTEQRTAVADAARLASDEIVNAVRRAGFATPGGIYVNIGGAPTLVRPVFGLNANALVPDDLWVVTPTKSTTLESCVDRGAASFVSAAAQAAPLSVNCTNSFATTDFLVATNASTGALFTPPLVLTGGAAASVTSADGVAGFSDDPSGDGFRIGDLVFPVQVLHYYVKANPVTGRPALFRSFGKVGSTAVPFVDDGASETLIQDGIEDLQLAFGVDGAAQGNPADYAFSNTVSPTLSSPGAQTLRSLRITVIAVADRKSLATDGQSTQAGLAPMAVEDRTFAVNPPPSDGYARSAYTRRVELPNLTPASL